MWKLKRNIKNTNKHQTQKNSLNYHDPGVLSPEEYDIDVITL